MNDVAVVGLAIPLKFSNKIQPIKLPLKPVTQSKVAFVGRGRDEVVYILNTLKNKCPDHDKYLIWYVPYKMFDVFWAFCA